MTQHFFGFFLKNNHFRLDNEFVLKLDALENLTMNNFSLKVQKARNLSTDALTEVNFWAFAIQFGFRQPHPYYFNLGCSL